MGRIWLFADFYFLLDIFQECGSRSALSKVEIRPQYDINLEPFHQGLKRKSNVSPDANRSFCYEYFEKRRNKTLNDSIPSNKSQKNIGIAGASQDIFTQIRNKTRQDQGSKLTDRARQNPQTEKRARKNYEQVKKASSRLHTLKKEQVKLKTTLENEFNAFKNLFYQLEQHVHHQQESDVSAQKQSTTSADQSFFRDLLNQAAGIEKYFQQMDRKKAALMQKLTQ